MAGARCCWQSSPVPVAGSHESSRVALIVVDHGSRSEASNASLETVVRQVAESTGGRFAAVLAAHMDLASPTIPEAFDLAVAAGAQFVVVALYFLAPGRHSETDVPALVRDAAARHPGVGFAVTSPLGPDAAIAGVLLERAESALSRRRS